MDIFISCLVTDVKIVL